MLPAPRPIELEPVSPLPRGIHRRWEWHYQTLAALRDQLIRDAIEPASPDEQYPFFPRLNAATAASQAEFEILLERLKRERQPLLEVEAALRRLHRGSYGRCEASGHPIPPARLRSFPWSRVRPLSRSVAKAPL